MTIQKPSWADSIKAQLKLSSSCLSFQKPGNAGTSANSVKSRDDKAILVIHGGAGTMSRAGSTPEQRARYTEALRAALRAGYKVLEGGGEAMDAAVAAVVYMEDSPLFNCARGAVFNVDGKNELESSLMLSKPPASHPSIPASRRGVGITLLTRARNPSRCAKALYLAPEDAPHTMLSGVTAESIAQSCGEIMVDPKYFYTEKRWREHRRELDLPEEPLPYPRDPDHDDSDEMDIILDEQLPTGTVGAVALDARGCIACVTSTGGRTNKLVGRIGDTPHMSAGFWAEEWTVSGWWRRTWRRVRGRGGVRAVGVSGTGDGDYFIRYNTAGTLADRMKYLQEELGKAASYVVEELRQNGGIGGVISLDNEGNFALCQNSSGMYRGAIGKNGIPRTAIFYDEELA